MACGDCARRAARIRSTTNPARRSDGTDTTKAVEAGSRILYEVITASGHSTGRKFTSLIAAQTLADRKGGTIRPTR